MIHQYLNIPRALSLYCCILIMGAGLFMCGCAASHLDHSFNNIPLQPAVEKNAPLPIVLGVDSFVDMRPQSHGDDNKKWLGLMPGVLWIEIDSDIPEFYSSTSFYNSRPFNSTFAEGVADALRRSDLFKSVVFIPVDPYRAVEYRLEGVLRRSFVKETSYYYGASFYVWGFRVLGFPYVSYDMTLNLDLRLRNMRNNQIVWNGTIEGTREDKYKTIYNLVRGKEGKHLIAYNFSKILSEKLPVVLAALSRVLAKEVQAKSEKTTIGLPQLN